MGTQLSFKLSDTKKPLPAIGKKLASGSSRIVYVSKRGTVLKVAKNLAGVEQNKSEVKISEKFPSAPIARVLDYAKDYSWVVAQRASQKRKISCVAMGELQQALPDDIGDIYGDNVGRIKGKPVALDYGFYGKSVRKMYNTGTMHPLRKFEDLYTRINSFPKHKSFTGVEY